MERRALFEAITGITELQDGLIADRQLARLQATRQQVRTLVRAGVLRQGAPGVYAIRGAPHTWRRSVREGLLSLGDDAWASHRTAAALWQLDRFPPREIELMVLRRRRSSGRSFSVHSTLRLDPIDRSRVDGLPCTTASRTILDLARLSLPRDRIAAAMDSAIRLGLSSPVFLARRLAANRGTGHWGVRLLDELLIDIGGHTMLERRFLELVRSAGLPRPRTQVIFRRDGTTFARVDFLFEEHAAVVEVTGRLGHTSSADRQVDAQRRNELQDIGLRVFEYTWEDVTVRPAFVVDSLRERLR